MRAPVLRRLDGTPPWVVALGLALGVVAVCLFLPFIVLWAWPGVSPVALVLGNLFLGMLLGNAAVLVFLTWRWEVRR